MKPPPEQARRLITLTTDFGTAGGYVGAIKGRILSEAPHAAIHDISHQIAPHSVLEGAWCLARAAPRFPPGTVHLAVVDPGVGSPRDAIVVETERFLLLGTDNGLLHLAAQKGGIKRIYAIGESPPQRVRSVSFDGLNFFAPAAASLLMGAASEELGEARQRMVPLVQPTPERREGMVEGEILLFDHFGNAITNITQTDLDSAVPSAITLAGGQSAQICSHYAEAESPGQIAAIWNSDGHLELALYGASLRDRHNLTTGERVRVNLHTT